MADYKDSLIWKKAFELAVEVSNVTKKQARAEKMDERVTRQHAYNIAAESIVSDIATAEGRKAMRHEYLRFLSAAQSATFRLESRILLDVERNYQKQEDAATALKLCGELKELLNAEIEPLAAEERAARLNRHSRPIDARADD